MIGQSISHYKILAKLGEGGMGVVYKARDMRLLRDVAVKVLVPELVADSHQRNSFIEEARTASSLTHPGICTIHDIGRFGTTDFIVMELVEGETLRQILRRQRYSAHEVIKISLEICAALAAVHARGILHRDLKPENIMVAMQGFLKVMDFGLAKLATECAEKTANPNSPGRSGDRAESATEQYTDKVILSNLSGFLGTVAYMSPEQAAGRALDPRSDIWSLGVILFEMLAGDRPFTGEVDQAIIYSILNEEPQSIRRLCPQAPAKLERLILKMLQKSPIDRYQSVSELLDDLKGIHLTSSHEDREARGVAPDAYTDYLKGLICFENFTPMNLQKSQEFLQSAVEKAPDFAAAHVALARTLAHLAMTSWIPPGEMLARARAAALHALKTEPDQADAVAMLGFISFLEFDWLAAEAKLKQSLLLDPESVTAKDSYAFYLTAFLHHDESIRHLQSCLKSAPNTCYYNTRMGWTYYVARRFDEALAQLQKTHRMFPELAFPHVLLSWCYTRKGMHNEALAECAKAEAKGVPAWQHARSYAEAGQIEKVRASIAALQAQNAAVPSWMVDLYLCIDEVDLALKQMQVAYDRREPLSVFFKAMPQLDNLRSDKRYHDMLEGIGLEKRGQ